MSYRRIQKYLTDLATLPGDAATAWRTAGRAGVWTEVRRRTGSWMQSRYSQLPEPLPLLPGIHP